MAVDAGTFLLRFAAPLLTGGQPACAQPMGARAAGKMGAFLHTAPGASELWDAIRTRAASVDPGLPGPASAQLSALLVAGHDLLTSVHPEMSNFLGGLSRLLQAHAAQLLKLGVPDHYPEALSRHAVMDALMRAVRVDTTVTWWTGSAQFHGEAPPGRLVKWPGVRRVRQDPMRVPLVNTGLTAGSVRLRAARRSLLEAMFTVSPITPLVLAAENTLPVPLDLRQLLAGGSPSYASLRLLDHGPLRTALADRAIASGFTGPAAIFSGAVNTLLTSASPEPWAVMAALRLLGMLHERRLFAVHVQRSLAAPGKVEPLVSREAMANPTDRMVYALWRAIRLRARQDHLPGAEPLLEPLALEIDQAIQGPAVVDMVNSYQRALVARLGH